MGQLKAHKKIADKYTKYVGASQNNIGEID